MSVRSGGGILDIIQRRNPETDFIILEHISSGMYREVYKARLKKTNELVALKIIKIEPTEDFNIIQQEIAIIADSSHPNIIGYVGTYLRRDRLWIATEYCSGGSAQNIYLTSGMGLDEFQIAFICRETLKGLQYLHEKQIMHREIKGENILLTSDGGVKLTGFGRAFHFTSLTPKSFIGSPYWMAPEVAVQAAMAKGRYNQLCDIWSLGITAIELAETQPPMFELPQVRVVYLITKRNFKPPGLQHRKRWSENFHEFLKFALQKEPKKRPVAAELLKHEFVSQSALSASLMLPCIYLSAQPGKQDLPALLANAAEDPPIPHSHENSAPPIPPRRRVNISQADKYESSFEHPSVSVTRYSLPELDPKEGYSLAAHNSVCLVYMSNDYTQHVCVVTSTESTVHPMLKTNEVMVTPIVCVSPHELSFNSEKPAIIELLNTIKFAKIDGIQKLKHNLVPIYSHSFPVKWKKLELQDCIVRDDRVTFKTNHFSYFAVIAEVPHTSVSITVRPDNNHEINPLKLTIPELPGFKVEIPPASVQCVIDITATVGYRVPELYESNYDYQSPASVFVILEPHNTQFSNRIPITIPIPGYLEITKQYPDIKLQLWYSNRCSSGDAGQVQTKWELVEEADISISCDCEGNYLATTYTTHFSIFRYVWDILIDWRLNYFAERIRGRCQVFMSHEVKYESHVTFGIAVLLYPFRDAYDKLDQYDYMLHDSCVPIEFFTGNKLCRVELNSSLPLDSENSNIEQMKRLSKDYEMRVDFSIQLHAHGELKLPKGMLLGNLHIDEHIQQHKFNLIKTPMSDCLLLPKEEKQCSENLIFIAAQQLHDSVIQKDDNCMVEAVTKMSNQLKEMAKCVRKLIDSNKEESKDELLISAYCVAEESRQVEEIARKLSLVCTEEGLRKAMLDVVEKLPIITNQLTILTRSIKKGKYDAKADREAIDMLTHNAQNLASKTEEVLHYIEIASDTGKIPSSSLEILNYATPRKCKNATTKQPANLSNPSSTNLTLIKYLKNKDPNRIGHFRLKTLILHKWKDIGNLVVPRQQLDAWAKKMDDKDCCHAMLCQWLDNPPDCYPATWEGLYDLLNDSELGQVAAELQHALENAIL